MPFFKWLLQLVLLSVSYTHCIIVALKVRCLFSHISISMYSNLNFNLTFCFNKRSLSKHSWHIDKDLFLESNKIIESARVRRQVQEEHHKTHTQICNLFIQENVTSKLIYMNNGRTKK